MIQRLETLYYQCLRHSEPSKHAAWLLTAGCY